MAEPGRGDDVTAGTRREVKCQGAGKCGGHGGGFRKVQLRSRKKPIRRYIGKALAGGSKLKNRSCEGVTGEKHGPKVRQLLEGRQIKVAGIIVKGGLGCGGWGTGSSREARASFPKECEEKDTEGRTDRQATSGGEESYLRRDGLLFKISH